MTIRFIKYVSISVFLLLFSQASLAEFADQWGQETVIEKMKSDDVVVIDVRSPGEYAEGHVPGAINIPHNKMGEHEETLASLKDKKLVLYCRSGKRAGMAESQLTEKGFKNLYHLEGDMQGWKAADRPIEK